MEESIGIRREGNTEQKGGNTDGQVGRYRHLQRSLATKNSERKNLTHNYLFLWIGMNEFWIFYPKKGNEIFMENIFYN